VAPLAGLLVLAFFYPLVALLKTGIWTPEPSLEHFREIAGSSLHLKVFVRTLWIAAIVTAGTLALGYPMAMAIVRSAGWRGLVLIGCVLVPLWTSVLVRSYAWMVLLQRNGLINSVLQEIGVTDQPLRLLYTQTAVVVAMIHVLLPFMVLPIFASLRTIPKDLNRAARGLGAGWLRAFVSVTLPLSMPGVFSGCLLVFVLALGFYVTPAVVGGPQTLMIATLIGQQVTQLLDWPLAAALSTVLLVLTLVIVLAFRRWLAIGGEFADG
jgi:mannopine transport system permease protein